MITSLKSLQELMRGCGADRIYAKRLSPNDNSKNQIYLGSGFSALNIIPHGEIYTDTSQRARSKQDRPKARVSFFWVDENGRYPAPNVQLILYPDYPEVRISGFLKGCMAAPSDLLTVRDEGRVLFFGVTPEGEVLGYATGPDDLITAELDTLELQAIGIFVELSVDPYQKVRPKEILIQEFRRINAMQWIASRKLELNGVKMPYAARNGGGYTLEAELGITPNGIAEPDFMGWEVKQYGVADFVRFRPKSPVTLMTPEPTGGIYKEKGPVEFLRRFGYADRNGKPDRINFGGIYKNGGRFHGNTGLRITVAGYDPANGKITDLNGGIALVNQDMEPAAFWSFTGMMEHWNRKHAQAAYVPSLFRNPPPQYAYGSRILLCEQTDFFLFLKGFASGAVYYDPAVKMEKASSIKPDVKRRSQFRVKHSDLTQMYYTSELVQI